MRSLGSIAAWSARHRALVLSVTAILTGAALLAARRIRIDTDVSALLPDTFESVRELDELRRIYGGVGYVAVVGSGASPESLRTFADELGARLESLPTVRAVEARRPEAFLRQRALYFVDRRDLERIAAQLEARHEREVARRSPFMVSLEDDPPPPLELDAIGESYPEVAAAASAASGETHHLSDGKVVVLARPTELASDLTFAQRVVADVRAVITELERQRGTPPEVELTGRYAKRVELQRVLEADLVLATGVAVALVGALMLLHFRRLSAIPLLLVPLAAGLVWTYGIAGLVFGSLNVLTAFLATILVGIGIDAGIHLLDGVADETGGDTPRLEAVRRGYGRVGRGAVAATATTAVAFLAIATGDLRAFRELGLLAAVGVAAALVAYVTILPALLGFVRAPTRPRRSAPRAAAAPRRWARLGVSASAAALLVAATGLPGLGFDYDFAHLDDAGLRSYELDREVNRLLGRSQTPLVVLGDRPGDASAVAAAIRARSESLGADSAVDRVVTLDSLVPAGQGDKRAVLDRIERLLSRVDPSSLQPETRRQIERWRPLLGATPFAVEDLPSSLRHAFDPSGDGRSEIALVFPSVSQSDGLAALRLSRELGQLPVPGGRRLSASGEAMVLADVVQSVRRDGWRITLAVGLAVLLTLSVILGGALRGLAALLPAVATLVGTLGAMALMGMRLDYMNVLVLPMLVGMAVDGGAHVVARWATGTPVGAILRSTGRSIGASTLTSAAGFGALLLAEHPGLASVGRLAVLGLAVSLVATLILLPSLLALLSRARCPGR